MACGEVTEQVILLADGHTEFFGQRNHRVIRAATAYFGTNDKDRALGVHEPPRGLLDQSRPSAENRPNGFSIHSHNRSAYFLTQEVWRKVEGDWSAGRRVSEFDSTTQNFRHGLRIQAAPVPRREHFGRLQVLVPLLETVLSGAASQAR